MDESLTMVMAGGKGERLYPLTKEKAKPAVTFGGIFKIIDFTLSNCLNSNIRRIYLLTQYSNATLDKHIRLGWNIFNHELGEFIDNIPPQQMNVDWWYQGTADSIFQNINILERARPRNVLILSGDHIYKMDYQKMLDFHRSKNADLTIACVELEREKAHQMGVLEIDESYRIAGFQEKPQRPKPIPAHPQKSLVSMGIYVFNTEVLVREIIHDAKRDTQHDFGKNIIPRMIKKRNVFAYNFMDENRKEVQYWRDVGSIDSYYAANMELLQEDPIFDLYDREWPIRTYQEQSPPARIVVSGGREEKSDANTRIVSLISNGCLVKDGVVKRSILSPFVHVGSNACVEDSILMKGVKVGRNARIRRAIIDEEITVPPDYRIGYDLGEDSKRFSVTESGIVVIPQASILD